MSGKISETYSSDSETSADEPEQGTTDSESICLELEDDHRSSIRFPDPVKVPGRDVRIEIRLKDSNLIVDALLLMSGPSWVLVCDIQCFIPANATSEQKAIQRELENRSPGEPWLFGGSEIDGIRIPELSEDWMTGTADEQPTSDNEHVEVDHPDCDTKLADEEHFKIRNYNIPQPIRSLLVHGLSKWNNMTEEEKKAHDEIHLLRLTGLTRENCIEYYRFLLYAEEFKLEKIIEEIGLVTVMLIPNHRIAGQHMIKVPGILDKSPDVNKFDTVYIVKGEFRCEMKVLEVSHDEITIVPVKKSRGMFNWELLRNNQHQQVRCCVEFTVNRTTIKAMHGALSKTSDHLIRCLFPESACVPQKRVSKPPGFKLFNQTIETNEEQLQAVLHIVEGTAVPYPYILFGPPGTGKTVTLVESIQQVWKLKPQSRILVAAACNKAADLVAQRLLPVIPKDQLVRLYSKSHEEEPVIPELEHVCQYGEIEVKMIKKIRVICCTFAMVPHLKKSASRGFFSHFFFDEAAQATDTLVILGLAHFHSPTAVIVLSGDPHQLGPVVRSKLATRLGFEISPMERLMRNYPIYKSDNNGNRNRMVITKLLKNFRSVKQLLVVPNELFYNNEVKAQIKTLALGRSSKVVEWLPNPNFRLVFHSMKTEHKRTEDCPSIFSTAEAEVVRDYVCKLLREGVLMSDIGIISPYRRQVRVIRELLENSFKTTVNEILIGSTEEFQGNERHAMIVSTVRSSLSSDSLGFLINRKRFNVAVTRARALLVVIGDPVLLSRHWTWDRLIKYCHASNGMTGVKFDPKKKSRLSERINKK